MGRADGCREIYRRQNEFSNVAGKSDSGDLETEEILDQGLPVVGPVDFDVGRLCCRYFGAIDIECDHQYRHTKYHGQPGLPGS